MMRVPSIAEAERLIEEAAKLNPGLWIEHNKTAGFCARMIAGKCDGMNPEMAYVMGLLHDIGRREGIMDMRHIYKGYLFMSSLGYDDSARICLTHSFPYKNIGAYNGEKRLVDVVIRRGFNELTIPKWKAFLELKQYFDEKVGTDIYELLSI